MTQFHQKQRPIIAFLIALYMLLIPFGALADALYREGDRASEILNAEIRLRELGYFHEEPDENFDKATTKAVKNFQIGNDLLESGMLDSVTLRVLYSNDALTYEDSKETILYESNSKSSGIARFFQLPTDSYAVMTTCESAYYEPEPMNTNEYSSFTENGFHSVSTSPLSTFAADVDTASYAQLRSMILKGMDVPESAVRVEEMLNYFHYDYAEPNNGEPFGVTMELSDCPWNEKTKLLLIGLQAQRIETEAMPQQSLVFLLDVSGSMDEPDKLPLVKRAFTLLLDNLQPTDLVSLVTYASYDEVVLDGVPVSDRTRILESINSLTAGGSTNGAAGIQSAYELAEKHFLPDGNNRILLATDGDLNVGISDQGSLVRLVDEKKQSGVMLSVLGFGDGNYKDNKMEALADYGNGNYNYIDTIHEARRTLITEAGGTFFTVAKDVKLQLDFNPSKVKGYRLIGYETRVMNDEDFDDDTKDGGEIGSGHRMTALYEIVPIDSDFEFGGTQSRYTETTVTNNDEWLTLSIRAKEPKSDESRLFTYPLIEASVTENPDENFRFAAAVAEYGMLLSDSEWKGNSDWDSALTLLRSCESVSGDPLKEELVYLGTLMERKADNAQ